MSKSRRRPVPLARDPQREQWAWLTLRVLVCSAGAALVWIAETLTKDEPNVSYGLLMLSVALLSSSLFFRGPRRMRDKVIVGLLGLIVSVPALVFVTLVVLLVEKVT
jgi:hypothetical protein